MTANEKLARMHEMRQEIADLWGVEVCACSIDVHHVGLGLLPREVGDEQIVRACGGGLAFSDGPPPSTTGRVTLYAEHDWDTFCVGQCSKCKGPVIADRAPGDWHEYAAAIGMPRASNDIETRGMCIPCATKRMAAQIPADEIAEKMLPTEVRVAPHVDLVCPKCEGEGFAVCEHHPRELECSSCEHEWRADLVIVEVAPS